MKGPARNCGRHAVPRELNYSGDAAKDESPHRFESAGVQEPTNIRNDDVAHNEDPPC